jgi:hypothetical protein
MILVNKHNRLKKRANAALLGGNAYPREAIFLHKISLRIEEYGNNTRLSDGQAKWLFKIFKSSLPDAPQYTLTNHRTRGGHRSQSAVNQI